MAFVLPQTPGLGRFVSRGVRVITVPDVRWGRCHVKTVSLLANVMAKETARRQGMFEALFVAESGVVHEGTSSNIFIKSASNRKILTPPVGPRVLAGVTRAVVIRLMGRTKFRVVERPVTVREMLQAEEVFLTGTTTEVVPVTSVNRRRIGTGKPGEVCKWVYQAYREEIYRSNLRSSPT